MIDPRATSHEATTETAHPSAGQHDGPVPELGVRDFSFYYDDFKALDSISFSVPQGRITSLIAASGSGKSTLLRAMNRMHDNTVGASPHPIAQAMDCD